MSKSENRYQFDFERDLYDIYKSKLLNTGLEFKDDFAKDTFGLLVQYFNFRKRVIDQRKRKIHYSSIFNCPYEYEETLEEIEHRLREGKSTFRYLSTNIKKLEYNDLMLNDWGIYHFHLGDDALKSDPKFIKRTGPLLYLRIDDSNAYFINIMEHKEWENIDILKLLHSNWPESISEFRTDRICDVCGDFSKKGIINLRRKKGTSLYPMGDGTVYAFVGGGYMSSGHSIEVINLAEYVLEVAGTAEEALISNMDQYIEYFEYKTRNENIELLFKLTIGELGEVKVLECNSREFIDFGRL